jgi:hypothetical protein
VNRNARAIAVVIVVLTGQSAPVWARTRGPAVQEQNPQALALSHFQERVKDYLAVRDKVKASLAPPTSTKDAHEIASRQQVLAAAVRRARAAARPGDVFLPEVVPILRRAIQDDFGERSPKERAATLQQVPDGLTLGVNDAYPKSVMLATVPPKLIAALPRLPDGLEYRFVGRRLILHDSITNLVVDVIEEALPTR